jgi:CBS domain-containing protein
MPRNGHAPDPLTTSGAEPEEADVKLANLMTREPFAVQVDAPVRAAAVLMADRGIGCVVVLDGARLAGIVTDRDITVRCVATGLDATGTPVSQVMTRHPVAVSPDTSADDALQLMVDREIGRLCVADGGAVIGIVSFGDLGVLAGLLARGLGRGAAATPPPHTT